MWIVANHYLPALIAALLIGVATAYWAFRRGAATPAAAPGIDKEETRA
jgi:hypothetical protein